MSDSREAPKLLVSNVPLSRSRSKRGSESGSRDEVPIHLQSVEASPGQMDGRSAAAPTDEPLFEGFDERATELEKLSDGQRLTQRQHFDIARGIHPLTKEPIAEGETRTCGGCAFRQAYGRYPKCWREGVARAASARTDVRAFWPACPSHVAVADLTEEQQTRLDCGENPAVVLR